MSIKGARRGETENLIRQSEMIEAEIKEVDLQLEELREKKTALSQALQMAANDENGGGGRAKTAPVTTTKISESSSEGSGAGEDVEEEQRAINSLSWRPFGPGKKGEWTFATDRRGNLVIGLASAQSLLAELRDQGLASRGGYNYKTSRDGTFLHRFPSGDSTR